MKEPLEKIVDKAIEELDYNKLIYMGISLDVMLFEAKHKDLFPIFYKITRFLTSKGYDIFEDFRDIDYPDLETIGFNNITK